MKLILNDGDELDVVIGGAVLHIIGGFPLAPENGMPFSRAVFTMQAGCEARGHDISRTATNPGGTTSEETCFEVNIHPKATGER